MASIIYSLMRDYANVYSHTTDKMNNPTETIVHSKIKCQYVYEGKLKRDWVRSADLKSILAYCKFDGDLSINYNDVVKILDDDDIESGALSFKVVDIQKPLNLHTGKIDHTRVMLA